METTKQQTVSIGTDPTLQVKRSLMPINEYAAREGVSVNIVNKCGKLGILQIRKYKDQIYVVDVPLSPYITASKDTTEPTESLDEHPAPNTLSDLINKSETDEDSIPQKAEQYREQNIKTHKVSKLLKKMFSKMVKILFRAKEKKHKAIDQSENISAIAEAEDSTDDEEKMPELIQTSEASSSEPSDQPELSQNDMDQNEDIFEILDIEPPEPADIANEPKDIIDEGENISEPLRIPDLEVPENPECGTDAINDTEEKQISEQGQVSQEKIENLTTKPGSKRLWQLTTMFSVMLFVAAFCANIWFYKDRQMQQNKLDQAFASVQDVYSNFILQKQNNQTLQGQMDNSEAKLLHLQNELSKSTAQIKSLKEELTRNQKALQDIQNQNSAGVQQLNEQIQRLANRITELTEKQNVFPESIP